jgi:hypothetical protein
MLKLWLPEKKLRTKKIDVPGLDEDIALNVVIVPGIVALDVLPGQLASMWERQVDQEYEGLLGHVKIFDIKHMMLGNLVYQHIRYANKYYHSDSVVKSPKAFRNHIKSLYDGIVDGQIVTVVFFTAEQDLLDAITEPDGTATETTCS